MPWDNCAFVLNSMGLPSGVGSVGGTSTGLTWGYSHSCRPLMLDCWSKVASLAWLAVGAGWQLGASPLYPVELIHQKIRLNVLTWWWKCSKRVSLEAAKTFWSWGLEVTCCFLLCVLLVKAHLRLADSGVRKIDSTSWWNEAKSRCRGACTRGWKDSLGPAL